MSSFSFKGALSYGFLGFGKQVFVHLTHTLHVFTDTLLYPFLVLVSLLEKS